MYNLRKTKSRDASMRSRSKSNSSMNVDNQTQKITEKMLKKIKYQNMKVNTSVVNQV